MSCQGAHSVATMGTSCTLITLVYIHERRNHWHVRLSIHAYPSARDACLQTFDRWQQSEMYETGAAGMPCLNCHFVIQEASAQNCSSMTDTVRHCHIIHACAAETDSYRHRVLQHPTGASFAGMILNFLCCDMAPACDWLAGATCFQQICYCMVAALVAAYDYNGSCLISACARWKRANKCVSWRYHMTWRCYSVPAACMYCLLNCLLWFAAWHWSLLHCMLTTYQDLNSNMLTRHSKTSTMSQIASMTAASCWL